MESENLKPMKTLLKHSVVYKLIGVFKKFLSIFRIIILFFKESMKKKTKSFFRSKCCYNNTHEISKNEWNCIEPCF